MLSIGKFAKSLGVSIQTLRNWDKEGKLKPTYVTENGYKYYSEDLLNKFRNIKNVNKIKKKIKNFRIQYLLEFLDFYK